MNESENTTAGTSSPSTTTSSSETRSLKWQLKSTQRRQRLRQEAIHSEPSARCASYKVPKRSRSAPGTVERSPEFEPPAPPLPPRDSLVTVKFALPTGGVLTRAFPGLTSIAEVRNVLAPLLGVNSSDLELAATSTDNKADDADVLADLGIGTFGVLSLRITNPPDARPRRDAGDILTAPPPDVLTVLVRGSQEKRAREVVVEVQRAGGASAKPFLGGLRNLRTGATFHHAATQTDRVQPTRTIPRFSRDTQAGLRRHRATATLSEHTVQTDFQPALTDGYIVLEGDAERFEAERKKRFESACILQRCLRRWLTKRKERPAEPLDTTPTPLFPEQQSISENTEPDIQTLLNSVYEWRRAEEERLQKITAVLTQRAERLDVLAEEARRLAQVDAVRVQHREARRRRRQEALLRKAARPKSWRGTKGRRLQADTPTTIRYRRLLDLYETTIKAWHTAPDLLREIADALQELTEIMSTDDILRLENLIRRRAAYLERGTGSEGASLLERVRDLFLEIPGGEQASKRAAVATCRSCGRPLPVRKFVHSVRVRSMRRCAACTRLSMAPRDLAMDTKLEKLTEMMRRNEIKMSDGFKIPAGSQPAFTLQPDDVRLLATRIWPGRSVLGGAPELERLRLGRWNCWKPFSPWNCVLLTASELSAHVGSTAACGPEMVYAPSLIARVRRRHLQARLRFRSCGSGDVSELDRIREDDGGEIN